MLLKLTFLGKKLYALEKIPDHIKIFKIYYQK